MASMKKDGREQDGLRPEYDFSKLKGQVRGKYAKRYREGGLHKNSCVRSSLS